MNHPCLLFTPNSGNTFYFRSKIPKDLVEHFGGMREFRISLKCAIKSRSLRTVKVLSKKVSLIYRCSEWIGFDKEGSSGQDEEDEENNIESSSFQKFHCSHQEIPAWEKTRGFHLSVNSLSLHEKTSLHLPVFQNRQKLVEGFRCWGCFWIFHSFHSEDQKFGHLW